MSVSFTHVRTKGAKITNEAAASLIRDAYDIRPPMTFPRDTAGAPRVALGDDKPRSEYQWPSAVRAEEMPDPDEFDDDYLLWDAESELHDDKGDQGFLDLLLALASCLEEPLIVQAADYDSADGFSRAAEWIVRPGANAVEFKEIVALRK